MLQEKGVVSDIVDGIAIVHTENKLACSSCQVSNSCGNGIVEKYLSEKIFTSEIPNILGAKIGDKVVIEIKKSSITRASLIVYFVPLLGLIFLSIIASFLGYSENITILFGLTGLFFGFLVTKYYNLKIANDESFSPTMVSIVGRGGTVDNSSLSIKVKSI